MRFEIGEGFGHDARTRRHGALIRILVEAQKRGPVLRRRYHDSAARLLEADLMSRMFPRNSPFVPMSP